MKRKLRLLFVIRALTIGGSERQVAQLCAGLAQRGHTVTLITYYGGGIFSDLLKGTTVMSCCLGKKGRWDIQALWRLRCQIHQVMPDVIYTFLPAANALLAAMRPLLPFHRLVWGVRASNPDLTRYDNLTRCIFAAESGLSSIPSLIIANSEAGRRHAVERGFPPQRLKVVPNGIDISKFRPADSGHREAARRSFGIAPDVLTIGVIARLDPMKDFATFLQAMSRISSDREINAVIAGPVADRERGLLEELASNLGIKKNLRWLGAISDMAKVYAAVDVVCLPSAFGEGFPNVLGEAMACGLPCIATDVGDCRSILGKYGTIVPPRDPEILSEALMHTFTLRNQSSLREKLRERVIEHYGLARMVSKTEELLLLARVGTFE